MNRLVRLNQLIEKAAFDSGRQYVSRQFRYDVLSSIIEQSLAKRDPDTEDLLLIMAAQYELTRVAKEIAYISSLIGSPLS